MRDVRDRFSHIPYPPIMFSKTDPRTMNVSITKRHPARLGLNRLRIGNPKY
jgi:hypothetical protein